MIFGGPADVMPVSHFGRVIAVLGVMFSIIGTSVLTSIITTKVVSDQTALYTIDSLGDISGTLCIESDFQARVATQSSSLETLVIIGCNVAWLWLHARQSCFPLHSYPSLGHRPPPLPRPLFTQVAQEFVVAYAKGPVVTHLSDSWSCVTGVLNGTFDAYITDDVVLHWVRRL